MVRRYSRLTKTEEKKNIRRAYFFGFLTIALIVVFIFLGLPAFAKFAGFLTDLRKSSEAPEVGDTTPPAPPRLEPLPEATNNLQVEIKGSTEPGATVVLTLNNKQQELLANKEGTFSYTFSLADGENTLSAIAFDSAGNESQKTKKYKITYDNDPPELAIVKPEDGSKFYGAKQRQIVIEGMTEEGASVNINERLVVVEADGSFSFATSLSEGENQFSIKASDKAGNTTEKSLTLHFTP
jgi:hypothetical protein